MPDEEVTVMRLGALSEEGGYPSLPQAVDAGLVDHDSSDNAYSSVNLGPIIEKTMVCAGSITDLPQDSCQADIGGTVMNEMGAQVGCHFICTSFGMGCARKGILESMHALLKSGCQILFVI
jgi:secreted trypsin-like serine protease